MANPVKFDFDGPGTTTIKFLKGTLVALHFNVADNIPITIEKATKGELTVSKCHNGRCKADVEYADEETFLEVDITTSAGASMNIQPPESPSPKHVEPNSNKVFSWTKS